MIRKEMDYLLGEEEYEDEMNTEVFPILCECCEETQLEMEDGASLRVRLYRNPDSDSVVCISHGFTEFADKYSEVIFMFLISGCSVAICEHRGHGFSTRELDNLSKVHIDSYDTYVEDYHTFVSYVKENFPDQGLLLYAHSMGGCIGALYLEKYPEDFVAAVLSSPMLDIDSGKIPKLFAYVFGRSMVLTRHGEEYLGSQEQDFKGDETFEESCGTSYARFDYWNDYRLGEPYAQNSAGTISWMTASLKAAPKAVRDAKKIEVPVLVCQAGNDTMVPPAGQERFVKRCPLAWLRVFETAKHEIYNSDTECRLHYWKNVIGFFGKVEQGEL